MIIRPRDYRVVLDADPYGNHMTIDGCDFEVQHLWPDDPERAHSPNASVFALYDSQQEAVTQVIKFCRWFSPCQKPQLLLRADRFEREVRALKKAREHGKNAHVIELFADGREVIGGKTFRYYTMEYADEDLSTFLRRNELEEPERYVLCAGIIRCIQALHSIGIYHRDIKPANFLIVDGNLWKIADLGLVDSREEDLAAMDEEREKIGPTGFLSPEALNKWIGLATPPPAIDDKSDVFQLAQVMGFVLRGEVFAGHLAAEDLGPPDEANALLEVMSRSFQYCKSRRYSIEQLRKAFLDRFGAKYALA